MEGYRRWEAELWRRVVRQIAWLKGVSLLMAIVPFVVGQARGERWDRRGHVGTWDRGWDLGP